MAYILDTGAVLRLLALRDDDEMLAWIETEAIRPMIAPTTMAAARESFQGEPSLTAMQRNTYEQRFNVLLRDLVLQEESSVIAADLDFNGSRILSDLLTVATTTGIDLHPFDLLPAAIAIQHNDEVVVADDGGLMARLARELPPESGHLVVRAFGPAA